MRRLATTVKTEGENAFLMEDCGMHILFFLPSYFLCFLLILAEGGLSQQGAHFRVWVSCTVHQRYINAIPLPDCNLNESQYSTQDLQAIQAILGILSIMMIYRLSNVRQLETFIMSMDSKWLRP